MKDSRTTDQLLSDLYKSIEFKGTSLSNSENWEWLKKPKPEQQHLLTKLDSYLTKLYQNQLITGFDNNSTDSLLAQKYHDIKLNKSKN